MGAERETESDRALEGREQVSESDTHGQNKLNESKRNVTKRIQSVTI